MTSLVTELRLRQQAYEEMLVACCFQNPDITQTSCAFVDPVWFSRDDMRGFWQACSVTNPDITAAATGQGKDFYTDVVGWLIRVPPMATPEVYAQHIYDLWVLRTVVVKQTTEMMSHAASKTPDMGAIVASAESIVNQTPLNVSPGLLPAQLNDELKAELHAVQTGSLVLAKTFIADLDLVIGGLEAGLVTLLAADTSMGKTTLALQIARNNAVYAMKHDLPPVLFFSLEMTGQQVWTRMAAGTARVDYRQILAGKAQPADFAKVEQTGDQLANLYGDKLVVVDDEFTVERFRAIAAQYRPSLVVVDHLDELSPSSASTEEHVWRGRAITYMKQHIAKAFGCPLLVLHQLNREAGKRKDKRPQLSDLRADGSIEQKSDVVIFLYRDDYYNPVPGATKVPVEVIFRKFRQGGRNVTVQLEYDLVEQWMKTAPIGTGGAFRLRP